MKELFRTPPSANGLLPGTEPSSHIYRLLSIAATVLFLLVWHVRATGHLSLAAIGTLSLFVALCLVYGRALLVAASYFGVNKAGVPFQLLCGFFLFNTLLLVLTLASPLGILANVSILTLTGVGLAIPLSRHAFAKDDIDAELPSLLCVLVSGLAASLWCSDAQVPTTIEGTAAIFRTWQDMFIHAREISAFAQSHGIGTLSDIKMSGVPAPIYHVASYISPAAVAALTGARAVEIYSGFQLPFGILLMGLAAFSLVAFIWGAWPALAATLAVVVLPDAYQQGFAHKYLSYYFMGQVNLGMLYGIACAAIAWIFILDGCVRGKYASVAVGYIFLAVCVFYKAHVFVANSFLMLMYPCLFFSGLTGRWRLLIGIAFVGLFVTVVHLSQDIGRVPVLRLDASGIGSYTKGLLRDYDPGFLKDFFTRVLLDQHPSKPIDLAYTSAMLLLSTFGAWVAVVPLVAALLRRRATGPVLFFPFLVVANYLVMAIGMAPENRGVGAADELLNRPLVWAYFAVAAWAAGAVYYLTFGPGLPRSTPARAGLGALICLSFASPVVFSRNLQTFPAWHGFARFEEFNSVPACLVEAAEYLRRHSHIEDVIQDSKNDPYFVVTALSERQIFAGSSTFGGGAPALQARLQGLLALKNMHDEGELRAYALSNGISWYLLERGSAVSWPKSFLDQAEFDCDGYRVFRLAE